MSDFNYDGAARALVDATGTMFAGELDYEPGKGLLIGEIVGPVIDAFLADNELWLKRDAGCPYCAIGDGDHKHGSGYRLVRAGAGGSDE